MVNILKYPTIYNVLHQNETMAISHASYVYIHIKDTKIAQLCFTLELPIKWLALHASFM